MPQPTQQEFNKYYRSMDALFDGRTTAFQSANPKDRPTPLWSFWEANR